MVNDYVRESTHLRPIAHKEQPSPAKQSLSVVARSHLEVSRLFLSLPEVFRPPSAPLSPPLLRVFATMCVCARASLYGQEELQESNTRHLLQQHQYQEVLRKGSRDAVSVYPDAALCGPADTAGISTPHDTCPPDRKPLKGPCLSTVTMLGLEHRKGTGAYVSTPRTVSSSARFPSPARISGKSRTNPKCMRTPRHHAVCSAPVARCVYLIVLASLLP
jgi:hypothetical protein